MTRRHGLSAFLMALAFLGTAANVVAQESFYGEELEKIVERTYNLDKALVAKLKVILK